MMQPPVTRLVILAVVLAFASSLPAEFAMQFPTMHARRLAGVVSDRVGGALPGVVVEECDPTFQHVEASTKTDAKGRFSFGNVKWGTHHYLRLRCPGYDSVRIPVMVWPVAREDLHIRLIESA
jgi:hypothetical protein